jgi:hypothetical protein
MSTEAGAIPQEADETQTQAEEQLVETAAGGEDAEAGTEDAFAIFGGEEQKVEKRQKDAHRATIKSVSENVSDKGSHSVRVVYLSDDTGNEITQDIWVPIGFVEGPIYRDGQKVVNEGEPTTGLFLTRQLGIEDLPPGEPDPDRPGKLKGNQRAHYGMSYKNSAGDASVQQLLAVATKEGRKPGTLALAFNGNTTFAEFCAGLNETLADLPVIVTRVPEISDENPRGFLKINRIYSQSIIEDPKALKALGKYVKHWTVGEE